MAAQDTGLWVSITVAAVRRSGSNEISQGQLTRILNSATLRMFPHSRQGGALSDACLLQGCVVRESASAPAIDSEATARRDAGAPSISAPLRRLRRLARAGSPRFRRVA